MRLLVISATCRNLTGWNNHIVVRWQKIIFSDFVVSTTIYVVFRKENVYRLKSLVARAYASKRATRGDNIAEACTACEACKEYSIRFVINIQICSVFDVEYPSRWRYGCEEWIYDCFISNSRSCWFRRYLFSIFSWKEFKISGITRVWLLALRTARRHARGRSLVFVFPLCAFAVRSRVRHHDLPCLFRKPRSL